MSPEEQIKAEKMWEEQIVNLNHEVIELIEKYVAMGINKERICTRVQFVAKFFESEKVRDEYKDRRGRTL